MLLPMGEWRPLNTLGVADNSARHRTKGNVISSVTRYLCKNDSHLVLKLNSRLERARRRRNVVMMIKMSEGNNKGNSSQMNAGT